jgi:phosphoenolpyruvate---glycerone phosphotransferase subunit DhaL
MRSALTATQDVTTADVFGACRGIAMRLQATAEELNALDAILGDGDLGSTLASVARALDTQPEPSADDLGEALAGIARVIAATSGSSFSGIMMTGLLRASRALRGRSSVTVAEIGPTLELVLEAMSKIGGGALGEKSVLDGIAAAAEALRHAGDGATLADVDRAVQSAIDSFRDRPCRIGRARLAAERSIGRDDPGMVALKRIVEGIQLGMSAVGSAERP